MGWGYDEWEHAYYAEWACSGSTTFKPLGSVESEDHAVLKQFLAQVSMDPTRKRKFYPDQDLRTRTAVTSENKSEKQEKYVFLWELTINEAEDLDAVLAQVVEKYRGLMYWFSNTKQDRNPLLVAMLPSCFHTETECRRLRAFCEDHRFEAMMNGCMIFHIHKDELDGWQQGPAPMICYRNLAPTDQSFFSLTEKKDSEH